MRSPRTRLRLLAVVAAGAVALAVATAGGGGAKAPATAGSAEGWRGLVGGGRAQVALGDRVVVVLRAPSLADRVARAGGRASDVDERRWTVAAYAAQQQLLSRLAARGIVVRPEFRFVRVVNAFSAAIDAQGVALLERAPEVAGVYPVRAAFPASISSEALRARGAETVWARPSPSVGGVDGSGITIALLDTGVQRRHPYLHGRVQRGYDVLAGDDDADAEASPADPAALEEHATQVAGILVGSGGPGGLGGVAPGARVLPIRVAGWQQDATGGWSVYARSDQILAGLERAVDPNADGDAHDAARIALVPLAEPYAAFADSPLARAVDGALRLDTLVVAPSGNDGPAGPVYGSVAGPGGAPAALTAAAADTRADARAIRVVLRTGLDVRLDRTLPLAGAVAPAGRRELDVATVLARRRPTARGPRAEPGATVDSFFDERGYSRVAGRAALVPSGARPAAVVRNAVRAGAAAVLLYGPPIPSGALGVDDDVDVPVVAVPQRLAAPVLALLRGGGRAAVTLGGALRRENGADGRVAAFSSRGLAFDGRLKPELVAPGVAVATSAPGRNDDGTPRYATVNGSSAAAAEVAAAGALLLQARPSLDGPSLKSLLVETARPLAGDAANAQGAGLVDVGAALAAEVAASPPTVALGRSSGRGWRARRWVALRNVSSRPLRVFVEATAPAGAPLRARTSVARLDLPPATTVRVRLEVRALGAPRAPGAVVGVLTVAPLGGRELRVPWSATVGPAPGSLIGGVRLSAERFRASDVSPAVLSLDAGRVVRRETGDAVEPVARLDVELWSGDGRRRLGTLARQRDLLPGRYSFGLTGRGPSGGVLPAGRYLLRLVATPTGGGAASVETLRFRIR